MKKKQRSSLSPYNKNNSIESKLGWKKNTRGIVCSLRRIWSSSCEVQSQSQSQINFDSDLDQDSII